MNFEFDEGQRQLKEEARCFLADRCSPAALRAAIDRPVPFDRDLWQSMAQMGFLGAAMPEEFGGLGASYLELCMIAEEVGRAIAPVPFSSSVYLASEFLLAVGSDDQKKDWLPKLAAGEAVGTFAFTEGAGRATVGEVRAVVSGGLLSGVKTIVPDGDVADVAIVAARSGLGTEAEGVSLFLVDLNGPGVTRERVETLDPARGHARLDFAGAPVEPLGPAGAGQALIEQVFDRAAVLVAFEQIGGADRALEMARDYALERMAFGRVIGSFQAVKHMLADMYVAATLARSNAYYGAWALSTDAAELPEAAATARVSATQAFQHCAKNNMQVHGGMGFTWELDCHLYYRRSHLLAVSLGPLSQWEERLIDHLRNKRAA